MIRVLFFILAGLVPVGLFMLLGPWALVVLLGLALATFLFSTGAPRPDEAERNGPSSRYRTTRMSGF
ncbi:MAG: hypothetical protein KKC85_03365 [Gammaproteobacteria bacterium]|nr:hypothetical protein [Gammaproteobacteria bacterium]MBU1444255.1 hypothetical protein [Gammaproteobacteria bacterium]MBU2285457.1 hypothetical protein [Gammaproteobacteria bacterium]